MNHLRSTTTPQQARTRWNAIAFVCMSLVFLICADARAARVVDLPASGNAAEPRLAMTDSGAYAITWRQQPTFGENERVYAQVGTISRPFKTKPTSPGLTKNLSGPLAAVASSGRDGIAWLGGVGEAVGVKFFGPRSGSARTVAWIEASKVVRVARLSRSGGLLSLATVHAETSPAALSGAQVRVDGAGNPTVLWSRESIECVDAPPADSECFPAAVFASTSNATGGFDPPQLIATDCQSGQIAESPTGAATIVASCGSQLKVSTRAAGQPFSEAALIPLLGAAEAGSVSIGLRRGREVLVAFEAANSFEAPTVRANLLLAVGQIGQPIKPPRIVRRGIRFESANNPKPSPSVIVTKRGRAYLRWFEDDRTKLALIKSSRRLGRAMTVPGFDRRGLNTMDAEVSVTDRGKALAVWNFISIKIDPAVRATTFLAPKR